jgi:uncharacterized membrane protein
VVAISWAGHRDLFAHIRRTDRNLVWLNVLYLLPLSLLPFGAALLSRYQQEAVALRIYGLQLLVIALTRLVVWLYAVNRQHLLFEPVSPRTKTIGVLLAGVPAVLYAVGILVAESSPGASLALYAGIPILYFIALFVERSTAPPGVEEEEFT